jgi:hypothetical protein
MPDKPKTILLTMKEYSFFTGRSWQGIRQAAELGRLPSVKVGGTRLIPVSEVDFYEQIRTR